MDVDKSKFNNRKEWRKFGIGLSIILAVLAFLQLVVGHEWGWYVAVVAVTVIIVAFLIPYLLKPLFVFFTYVGFVMGWVMTRLILIILFYLVLTPVSLTAKLLGKSFLALKTDQSRESYWEDISQERHERIEYERQF
jgi:hypothetical protein